MSHTTISTNSGNVPKTQLSKGGGVAMVGGELVEYEDFVNLGISQFMM